MHNYYTQIADGKPRPLYVRLAGSKPSAFCLKIRRIFLGRHNLSIQVMHRQGPHQSRHISVVFPLLPCAGVTIWESLRREIHKVTYNSGPETTEEGKYFYLIPSTMESFPVRSVGLSVDYELPLPNAEMVGLRARITCKKSPRKSGLKQEAELLPWDIQMA